MPRWKAVFTRKQPIATFRDVTLVSTAGRVVSLGCLTFVFCFVFFVGLFVVIVFFFDRDGGDFLANAKCNCVKKH